MPLGLAVKLRRSDAHWCAKSGADASGLLVDYARYKQLYSRRSARFSHHVWFDVLKEKAAYQRAARGQSLVAVLRFSGGREQLRLDSERTEILKGKKPAGAHDVATTHPDWRKAVLKTARAVCNGSLVEKKELSGR